MVRHVVAKGIRVMYNKHKQQHSFGPGGNIDAYHSAIYNSDKSVILYNHQRISQENADRLVKDGGESPYVLKITEEQMDLLFLNKCPIA